jgi:hypothetical protein
MGFVWQFDVVLTSGSLAPANSLELTTHQKRARQQLDP